MALENFAPTIWAAKLFVRLRKALVFASVVNREYEGEITGSGSSVKINEIGPITVNSYTRNADITYETLDDAAKWLLIDQEKYFAFQLDDVDAAQAKPKVMDGAMGEAAYAVSDTIDQHIAGLYAQAGVTGSATYIGSAASSFSVSSGNVIETVSYVKRYLDEANVPQEGRWGIVPPWFIQKLVLAEAAPIGATGVPKLRDDGVLMNGWVVRTFGFDLLMSNNVSNNGTQYRCMFGNRTAISHAGQITKIEAVRRDVRFADAVRGLYVYGSKVVRPNALCTAYLAVAAG